MCREVIKEVPVERIVPIEREIPIEIHVQSPIDRVIEVIKEVPTTRMEEKVVQVTNEVLKTVNVDKIVERNVETIKEVHAGPEKIVPVQVEKIVEVPILVNVPQVFPSLDRPNMHTHRTVLLTFPVECLDVLSLCLGLAGCVHVCVLCDCCVCSFL